LAGETGILVHSENYLKIWDLAIKLLMLIQDSFELLVDKAGVYDTFKAIKHSYHEN